MLRAAAWLTAVILMAAAPASAQQLTSRGFLDARGVWFPRDTPHDRQHIVVDVLGREEVFFKPASWVQFAAGLDFRANTGDQVADSWRPDLTDRGIKRPILSVRRLSATLTRGRATIDLGKQFIRWGKTDIVTPTDRFAPRDFLNVIDSEFFAVLGLRGVVELASNTIDAVWVPAFTPSRIPLLSRRWTVIPPDAPIPEIAERIFPKRSQAGIRWSHTGSVYEYSLSFFDGANHLPNVEPSDPFRIALGFPALRMYGGDAAVPARWFTLKGEAAYFTSSTPGADQYILYVLQLERQAGEWLVIGGYAGEVVTERRALATFAPDRGTTRSVLGRASYTIDANRSVAFEAAVRQNLDGVYAKAEYSQARGDHWRATVTGALLQGDPHDFIGQYRRNSHLILAVRYSF
jgi:hypothetical protein